MPQRKATANSKLLLQKYNALYVKERGASSQNSMLEAQQYLKSSWPEEEGLEVRQWQDGTLSDFGDCPRGCGRDLWLPAQLKTTTRTSYPFQFKGCGKVYPMDIIAMTGDTNGAFVYSPEFVAENSNHMLSNGKDSPNDTIKVTSGARNGCVWNIGREDLDAIARKRLSRWYSELHLMMSGYPSLLCTERELRMQCHEKSRCEYLLPSCQCNLM